MLNHAEQQLGFALFERGAQGMVATREGRRLIPEVQGLYIHLQAIGSLTEQMKRNRVKNGAAGGGAGIVDLFTAHRYADMLKIVPIAKRLPFEVTRISRRDNTQSRAALQLKQLMKNKCGEIAGQNEGLFHAA